MAGCEGACGCEELDPAGAPTGAHGADDGDAAGGPTDFDLKQDGAGRLDLEPAGGPADSLLDSARDELAAMLLEEEDSSLDERDTGLNIPLPHTVAPRSAGISCT